MSDHDQEKFEAQLRRIKPAALPEDFNARLLAAQPKRDVLVGSVTFASIFQNYLQLLRRSLRWSIPAAAMILGVLVVWRESRPGGSALDSQANVAAAPVVMTADDVKIDQQLVSSFDAVARLPSGEPVRFRCENWVDEVVLSDKSKGMVVENRQPRFEVVALGFETY